MCLPVTPYKVEREWEHAGLKCAVVQAREAEHRCGYVRVPPGHPLHGKTCDTPEVSVHSGLTLAELEPCTEHPDGQGWWFGFDCAHCDDAMYDPAVNLETVRPATRRVIEIHIAIHGEFGSSRDEHYWTEPEVVAETEQLAEQLAAVR